jgi:serine-type D-Ala-D-Ala carboxypeptidase (penicillin-binding protein 5/6)
MLVAIVGVVVVALTAALTTGDPVKTSKASAAVPKQQAIPTPTVASLLQASIVLPGHLPALPWPATGEGAVAVQGIGAVAAGPNQVPRPIASVTKVMTALIVLRDHPLSPTSNGPEFRMTAADNLAWIQASVDGDSNLEVVPREELSERQLLEALMIPSADNIANYLAVWDAGSIPAFVAKMNAEAALLGMTDTHYADASGLDPASRSTAVDQARLAGVAMAIPALAGIVDNASARMPTGEVWGYNPLVGVDGVVGLKSGFTQAAQACLSIAARRTVGGRRVLVIVVTLGQPDGLYGAASADQELLDAVTPVLRSYRVLATGAVVAQVRARWSATAPSAVAASAVTVVGWPGLALGVFVAGHVVLPDQYEAADHRGARPSVLLQAGSDVGAVIVTASGTPQAAVPITLADPLAAPPAGWSASASAGS